MGGRSIVPPTSCAPPADWLFDPLAPALVFGLVAELLAQALSHRLGVFVRADIGLGNRLLDDLIANRDLAHDPNMLQQVAWRLGLRLCLALRSRAGGGRVRRQRR